MFVCASYVSTCSFVKSICLYVPFMFQLVHFLFQGRNAFFKELRSHPLLPNKNIDMSITNSRKQVSLLNMYVCEKKFITY